MEIISLLNQKGIRPSVTRIKILEYLRSVCSHPTVSEVYSALVFEIPTLSLTTVYNTLKLFAGKGIVKVLTIDGSQVRYDGCTDFHGHFMCSECGTVYDFEVSDAKGKGLENFKITAKEVFYSGICDRCL